MENPFDRKIEETLAAYVAGSLDASQRKKVEEELGHSQLQSQYVDFLRMAEKTLGNSMWKPAPPSIKRNTLFEITRPVPAAEFRKAVWLTAAFLCLLAGIFIGRQWFTRPLIILMPYGAGEPRAQESNLGGLDKNEEDAVERSLHEF